MRGAGLKYLLHFVDDIRELLFLRQQVRQPWSNDVIAELALLQRKGGREREIAFGCQPPGVVCKGYPLRVMNCDPANDEILVMDRDFLVRGHQSSSKS